MVPASERRRAVLAALRDASGEGVSGERLAESLAISRVAVGKHIAALRESGYVIDAVLGSGYRLRSAPDLPLPEEVEPLLSSSAIWRLSGGHETGSTSDDAKALARAGASEGTAVLASRQTAGRGRLGRTWVSPTGGLYLSLVLRPPLHPSAVAPLALAVGVGVARGLERLGAAPGLKWPNDVLLPDPLGGLGKVAGILLEMSAEADAVDWVVAGIGTNVRRPSEADQDADAAACPAYLADALGRAPRLAEVAAAVLEGVAESYATFLGGGFDALAEEYAARDRLRGREVTVRDVAGREMASGVVEGVDHDGRLVLHNGGVPTAIAAGEVTLRP